MQSIKDILNNFNNPEEEKKEEKPQTELFDTKPFEKKKLPISNKGKYMTKEYQMYGMRLAGKLDDRQRASMYIKWAKEKPRAILEIAYSFAIDYPGAKEKSRIFMWKVKELEKDSKAKKSQ
jgi:hypothetical protein